jgi:diaminopimelate epimerase
MTYSLSKFHGLGNDFLVIDLGQQASDHHTPESAWPQWSRVWCDRRRGIGADGLLLLGWHKGSGTEVSMVLYNADGSRAEISGNGIRCLVHAAYMAQQRTGAVTYQVSTDAGLRMVEVTPQGEFLVQASVDMGVVDVASEPRQWSSLGAHPDRPVAHVSLGNPHTVVGVDDVAAVDLASLGQQLSEVNLEIIEPGPEPDAITMRVHERGVGATLACGSGACAAAWAAMRWGLVPASSPHVIVHMDGGDARVLLPRGGQGSVTLIGPSQFVANLVVPS